MSLDDDSQIIFGDLVGLTFPDICLADDEKPRKNLTQETCPDRGSNPSPLRDCTHRLHNILYTVYIFEWTNCKSTKHCRTIKKKWAVGTYLHTYAWVDF